MSTYKYLPIFGPIHSCRRAYHGLLYFFRYNLVDFPQHLAVNFRATVLVSRFINHAEECSQKPLEKCLESVTLHSLSNYVFDMGNAVLDGHGEGTESS